MAEKHPKLGLAYLLAILTAQTGLYQFYLRRTGSGLIMLAGFVLIPVISLVAAPIGLYFGIGLALFLTLIVIKDLVSMRQIVRSVHSEGVI